MLGQGLATLIPFAAAPILGRLYTPADYGPLAAYMALAAVLATASTLQMNQGIVAERSERQAMVLVSVTIAISIAMAVVTAVLSIGIYFWASQTPGWKEAAPWLMFLPVTILASGLNATVISLANRRTHYGFIARLQVMSTAGSVLTSIMFGFAGFGYAGLLAAYLLQQCASLAAHLFLLSRMIKGTRLERRLSRLRVLARRHKHSAIYTLPASFIASFNLSLPVFALSSLGAAAIVGNFNRARQLVTLPLTILGFSIGSVFRQRAAVDLAQRGTCRPILKKTFVALFSLALPSITILAIIAPDLLRIVMGPNWEDAGYIVRILAPMLLVRFCVVPLMPILLFPGNQHINFFLSLFSVVTIALCTVGPMALGGTPIAALVGYSAGFSVVYVAYFIACWRVSARSKR